MTQSPLVQPRKTLNKKKLSKEEIQILEQKDKELKLEQSYIIARTCFIDGQRWPDVLPVMSRTIAGVIDSIRVCSSCQINILKWTPARITSFVKEDTEGRFDETKVQFKEDIDRDCIKCGKLALPYFDVCIDHQMFNSFIRANLGKDELLTLEVMNDMTKEQLIAYMVLHEVIGWNAKMNKPQLIELIVDKYENELKA